MSLVNFLFYKPNRVIYEITNLYLKLCLIKQKLKNNKDIKTNLLFPLIVKLEILKINL